MRLVWSCLLSYRNSDLYFQGLWIDVTCFSVFSLALVIGMMRTDMRGIHFGKTQNGLAFMGLVSYEIYLVHVPIITILKHFSHFDFDGGKLTLYLVTMVLSTVVAFLMHRFLTATALKKREGILAYMEARLPRKPSARGEAPVGVPLNVAAVSVACDEPSSLCSERKE
ncbi:MAG: hypothetical protein Q8Q59_14800 [Luteolibacter sp.]|jgi:peptidoglycan/LPS O-acetylase OafA/YrhL|nr:hypothetical protein [Luteolibacter sp.]